jgi:hypothetical protein
VFSEFEDFGLQVQASFNGSFKSAEGYVSGGGVGIFDEEEITVIVDAHKRTKLLNFRPRLTRGWDCPVSYAIAPYLKILLSLLVRSAVKYRSSRFPPPSVFLERCPSSSTQGRRLLKFQKNQQLPFNSIQAFEMDC